MIVQLLEWHYCNTCAFRKKKIVTKFTVLRISCFGITGLIVTRIKTGLSKYFLLSCKF